jgi:hypothetical protein
MTLLKPLNNISLLLPYEQYYIQSLHHEGKLILEQSPGETNPLFQMAINPHIQHEQTSSASAYIQIPHHTTPAKPQRNNNTHHTRYKFIYTTSEYIQETSSKNILHTKKTQ